MIPKSQALTAPKATTILEDLGDRGIQAEDSDAPRTTLAKRMHRT
jgi:hypothetical protein